MKFSYMTSASFNQNPSRAKKEANEHPLVITEHGEASYVLVRYSEFEANWRRSKSLLDALRDPASDNDSEFEPARLDFNRRDVEF
jgi:PHD/YefM family antitoxin component YafN of YafNO toxin-antitoxin module